ncbi:MAG TPA: phospholipase D-like domain-containing protein [Vicinamibacterales bacterium]|nr:phospholipase D-like domain-containing protein [Vicinamibacterales bacterium]
MRKSSRNGDLSVRAIVGSYVTLLGVNVREGSPMLDGLLGFALWRKDHTDNKEGWLSGIKRFASDNEDPHPTKLTSTQTNPLQGFLWGDYAVKAGHQYTYRVVPMYGAPGALTEGNGVEVKFKTEPEIGDGHSVYFNRGAAASQAYARKFKNEPPDRVKNPDAYPWLSRGLEEGMQRFIRRAKKEGLKIRAAVYEFYYDRMLEELAKAARDGVDVQIVYDCKKGEGKPGARNTAAIKAAGLDAVATCSTRSENPSYIAHNKFIVLVNGQKPVAVWTGSTNITEGGIFGHSNLAHIVEDPKVAGKYLKYWKQLAEDPAARDLREWNDENTPVPDNPPPKGTSVVFSPRGSIDALQYYADLMDGASSGVFFTAAFGVNARLRRVLATDKPYLRYLLLEREDRANDDDPDIEMYRRDRENLVAVGSHLDDNVLEQWVQKNFGQEELTGTNKHVKYIHTKYMLIDPLSDDPIVVTGSANFSDASTKNNDENMLIIRGDTRVADIYLGEFMRLYTHYRFRAFAQEAAREGRPPKKLYLTDDDSWMQPYYKAGSVKAQERLMFAGLA